MSDLAILGVPIPADPDLVTAAIGAGVGGACVALAWLIGRFAGPPLSRQWERLAGGRSEGIADRMCDIIRSAIAAILLAIALEAYAWPILAAFILGLFLAAAVAFLVAGVVRGLALPRWVIGVLASVAFLAVLAHAMGGLEPVTAILDRIGFSIGRTRFSLLTVLQAVVTILVLFAGVRLINRIVGHSVKRSAGLDATQQLLAQKLVSIAVLVAAFFIGIDFLGIDLTTLAVFSGAFGLAIGFGLQKTFGNLIAGIILLMDRSIKPGDVIVVGESFGHVNKIGVRAVSIITRDGKEHLIPNENLMTQEVENWSYSSANVRVHIPVGVSYNCDLALAQKLMIEAAQAPDRVLKTPKPNVWLREFGENSVNHEILVWIKDPEAGVGNVQSEILNRLWVLFKENGVEIPFPQRDIHVKEWPGKDA